ncbi:MAG: hypothetical protein H0V03_04620, partial [Thermoleophilaceae bacterium]|nr:hypothetical protein [Thermoleophilaceae bacterium]
MNRGGNGSWLALPLALGALALAPASAAAQGVATRVIDRAATSLRSDPIYVDPEAEARLDEGTAARIRQRIEERGAGPMYVAVLADEARNEAGGDPSAVGAEIARRLGADGTYAVVVGNSFRAGSRGVLESGEAPRLARAALDAHGDDGVGPILLDFVDRVGEARAGGGSDGSGEGGGGPGGGFLIALLAGGAALFGLRRFMRERRRRREL